MDKELHEKALKAALDEYYDGIVNRDAGYDCMHSAIAAYLKTAGLTVVPVEPTETITSAGYNRLDPSAFRYGLVSAYRAMLAAFSSPFKDMP